MSAALLWLLTVSISEAAPGPRRAGRAHVCDAQATTIRKLLRRPRSFGGPVAHTRRTRLGLLIDFSARLHRAVRVYVDDDGDAIQNDGAATSVDPDDRAVPGLRPLGIVIGSVHRHPPTHAFSPRSPRGPPTPV